VPCLADGEEGGQGNFRHLPRLHEMERVRFDQEVRRLLFFELQETYCFELEVFTASILKIPLLRRNHASGLD